MRGVRITHPLAQRLTDLHAELLTVTDGEVASYIPALAKADPACFALSLVTTEGHRYGAGDCDGPFTIQSVSKPFVYALALADSGVEHVLTRIGTEPTGDAFNAVTLESGTGRPLNPMVNAGAIEAACLVAGDSPAEKTRRIVDGLSAFAGRDLTVDSDVYHSEAETGDRNRALAYLMHGAGSLSMPVGDALEVYFAQCSVTVTSDDLAMMAATLATGGVNPRTGNRVVPVEVVGPTLSVMATCGMYDAAGTWLFKVGLPAKSGVSGGVLAVLPGQFGVGLWSPPLDQQGNSVRSVMAAERLSGELGLHMFTPTGPGASPVRRWTTGKVTRSVAARSVEQRAVLDEVGERIQVVELQGPLHDLAVETLVHRLIEAAQDAGEGWLLVLDMTHVGAVHPAALDVLAPTLDALRAAGGRVTIVDPHPTSLLTRHMPNIAHRRDRDQALTQAEDVLLAEHGHPGGLADAALPFADHEVLGALEPSHRSAVEQLLDTTIAPAGTIVMEAGSDPDGLVWVSAGELSVMVRTSRGPWRRVSGIGPGGVIGEISFIDGLPRSARVVTESASLLRSMDAAALATLAAERRDVYATLMLALARLLSSRLRRATATMQALQD
jgi:glutaminase